MEAAINVLNETLLRQRNSTHVSLPTFKGTINECINEFLTVYEYSASLNGWNDEKKAQHLFVALEGDAKKWFALQIPTADEYTWTDWQAKLRATFRTQNTQEMAYLHLNQRAQALDESAEHFYYDVLGLCARVDPLMTESEKVRHLLRAVRPELLPSIMIMNPKTADEFLKSLQQLARTRIMMKNNAFFASTSPDTAYHMPFADLAAPAAMMPDHPMSPAASRDTVTVRRDDLKEIMNLLRPKEANPVTPVPPIPERDFCAESATHALAENAQALKRDAQEIEERWTSRQQQEAYPPRKSDQHHNVYLGVTTSNYRMNPKVNRKVLGTVQWYNVTKRYGFINRHDTKEDVFVHQTEVIKNNPKKAVQSLGKGEIVEFDVVNGKKGSRAIKVTGPGGVPVVGNPHARNHWIPSQRRFVPLKPKDVEQPKKYLERQHQRPRSSRRELHQTGYFCLHNERFERRHLSVNIRSNESDSELIRKIAKLCREKNRHKNQEYRYSKNECSPPQFRVAPEDRLTFAPSEPEKQASHLPSEPPCKTPEQPEMPQKEATEQLVEHYQKKITDIFKSMIFDPWNNMCSNFARSILIC